jgi:hypothetical protein
MGIVYGAMLACLVPQIQAWAALPTGFVRTHATDPGWLGFILTLLGCGVFLSGARDAMALTGAQAASWPWRRIA